MRGARRTLVITAAALVAAAAVYLLATLPPQAVALPALTGGGRVLYGAYHVHSERSDGTGSIEDIAAAASRAGLQFVIITDHGDATAEPFGPAYLDGVLVIDATEISTFGGHLVALGLDGPAPYPLAGEARDVVEDVRRLGGFAVIAHPESPRPALRWRATGVAYDGFEWLNADSEWRDETALHLVGSALRGLLRGPETVASLFERSDRAFARWDARRRQAFGLAALDVHARIGWDSDDDSRDGTSLARPSYQQMFRAVAQVVSPEPALSGDAGTDAARVLDEITAGRTYSIVRAIGDPAALEFSATQGVAAARMGDRLAAGLAMFDARVPGVPEAALALLQNGRVVARGQGSLVHEAGVPPGGVFRVEVTLGSSPFPWIVSNPIYGPAAPPAAVPGSQVSLGQLEPLTATGAWRIERSTTSTGEMATDDGDLVWRFRIGPGEPAGQFAALVAPIEGEAGYEHVRFTARASRPMRLSVQVRLPGSGESQRWGRSVYLDTESREIVLRLEDMVPVGRTSTLQPVVARLRSLLFVIDTLNTRPGSDGEIRFSNVALGVGPADGGAGSQ